MRLSGAVMSAPKQSRRSDEICRGGERPTESTSVDVLRELGRKEAVCAIDRSNGEVSAARNSGLVPIGSDLVAVRECDDAIECPFLARTAANFSHRKSCPATVMLRREASRRCGGYDEARPRRRRATASRTGTSSSPC